MAVQKRIVGDDKVDAMYAAASDDETHFQRYLSANCFGDYLTRAGLDVRTRELLTFSMLVALGGADAQVKGHVAANLNVGNDRAALLAVLDRVVPVHRLSTHPQRTQRGQRHRCGALTAGKEK